MSPMELVLWSLLAIVSVIASAMCSGVEIGCYTLNRVRLDLRSHRQPPDVPARIIQRELERPDRLLSTLLISNNIVNYTGALATTALFEATGQPDGVVAVLNTCVLAPVLFVLGEAFPKEFFRGQADRLTYVFARPLAAVRLTLTFTGVLPLVRFVTSVVERAAGLPPEHISDARQRIALLLKEGAGHGVLSESQVTLVDRALLFQSVTVGDEMVPWSAVRAIPADSDRARVPRLIGDAAHARIPVVDRRGRVTGVLRQLDLHTRPDAPLAQLVTPPVRLLKSTSVHDALVKMRESKARLAIVEDDQGRPVGIVTTKDLVEPLTGELADL
jgi:putative hemolysin